MFRRVLLLSAALPAGVRALSARHMDSVLENFLGVPNVPQLGLGLAALARPGYINLNRGDDIGDARSPEAMELRTHDVLDAARRLGIRYFDCARSYGLSEDFLASWLAKRPGAAEECCVGSKWGYRYTADWRVDTGGEPHEVKDHSVGHFLSQKLETVERLGGNLNLYQIHSATLESGVLDDEAVLDALRAFRAERNCRLGLSLSGVQQSVVLAKAMETGVFDCVQATFNCLEQSAGEQLRRARESGMHVIVKEAMANGRVLRHPALTRLAERLGVSPDALALAAVMVQPFEPLVLSGAVTVAQLESNAGAAEAARALRAQPQLLADLLEDMRVAPEDYWAERSALQWN